MSDYANMRAMEIGEAKWTAPPVEKPPITLSDEDTTRIAENELDYIAQVLHDEYGYSSEWSDEDTVVEVKAIVEEMRRMLSGDES